MSALFFIFNLYDIDTLLKGFVFILTLLIFVSLTPSCNRSEAKLFRLKGGTGIHFKNTLKPTPELNILSYLYYYNGAGVCAADFNNDGFSDLYFTSNQGQDELYLNKGDLKFEEISDVSGIVNNSGWTTGVTNVDINNDGYLDIYICKIGDYQTLKGKNLLYVNQGVNEKGIPTFKEMASEYGLDIQSFSTQAAFLDYDLDGDLDMFLLNHSVHPNSNYGKGAKRMEADSLSGDILFRNDNGYFYDVSQEAGIFQGKIGYGLGVSVSDVNNDGYPDIYVSNDFFENNYLYINQKDGSFKEIISTEPSKMGHTAHFSMGSDIADINNDGYPDIIALDMLPEDLQTYKTSALEYPYQTYEYYLKNGYAPQYMQNTLHLNLGNSSFSETSFISGIAATEWSWSALFADFDNDGFKDLHISNGIKGATNDMDFINFIANENIQKRISQGMSEKEMAFIKELPEKKVPNYFYKNHGDNTFSDVTSEWFRKTPSFSNGAIYDDLDRDGDLDLIISNIDEEVHLLENLSDKKKEKNNFISLEFDGSDTNRFGIGARVILYRGNSRIVQENYATKGYLSSSSPQIHIGLGTDEKIDSLRVIWPDRTYEFFTDLEPNQHLKVDKRNARRGYIKYNGNSKPHYLLNAPSPITFRHTENSSLEFNRDPLIPFANTNQGPAISVADVNGDGKEDLFIGGAKGQASRLLVQKEEGLFEISEEEVFSSDIINEDVDQLFFDADNDGDQDLLIVSGGNEFKKGPALSPRLYFNENGSFKKDSIQFKDISLNASTVKAVDLDNDGDQDLSITSNGIPWQFGKTPRQYLFENNGKGTFTDITDTYSKAFRDIGLVQDIQWIDINGDNFKDAVLTGHWMPLSVFINDGKSLKLMEFKGLDRTNGWWNTVVAADFDKDGDIDLMAGNWGLNTRLTASEKQPLKLYSNDFDDNGSIEPVITYFYQGTETVFASKDELIKQMPFINKKYLSYKDFAKADFDEIFPKNKIKTASKKQLYQLASCYFENNGNNSFSVKQLPFLVQTSSVHSIFVDDFNSDGYPDVLIAGNNYEISTQLGRLDALHGLLLLNDRNGFFTEGKNQLFDIPGPARDIEKIMIDDTAYYIISINNNSPVFLKRMN
ncbi:hypothetical protein GWK08_14395 [Leptobacterium flavescens]|uniref:ASPIC/UnbV domain-containing protein n=1 Tax=Leptobacterium flavescens TaxID=472055 RepID=A0A6P0UQ53_9FLAO|nr:VCBS repeat-containing protein [Leptobacterium flavescens]NER14642.1 hypothetical protein [Leptobacterium flavescens]